jgi:hypothetical protein
MASPVEGRRTPPANDEEDLAFLAETHMMNSALNRALEGLGDYGVYADVIRLRNGRRRANELNRQNAHIKGLELFARQQRLRYEHQRWEHTERQKEVRARLIRANASGHLRALIREDPELGEQKREHEQVKLSCFFSLTVRYDWTGFPLTDTYHIPLTRYYDEA